LRPKTSDCKKKPTPLSQTLVTKLMRNLMFWISKFPLLIYAILIWILG